MPQAWNAWHQLRLADYDFDVPEPIVEGERINTTMNVRLFDVVFPVTILRLTVLGA